MTHCQTDELLLLLLCFILPVDWADKSGADAKGHLSDAGSDAGRQHDRHRSTAEARRKRLLLHKRERNKKTNGEEQDYNLWIAWYSLPRKTLNESYNKK